MQVIVTTAPVNEPVSLEEIYDHLRLDAEGSPFEHPLDALLTSQLVPARALVEQHTRRSLMPQTLLLTQAWLTPVIALPRPPIASVTSVKYYDAANVLQTIATDQYFLVSSLMPQLQFVEGFAIPQVYKREDTVQVAYQTGYASAGLVPQGIKNAIKLHVQLLYDELAVDEQAASIRAIESILASYRVHSF